MESPTFSELITQQITRQYQQGEGFLTVMTNIKGMIAAFARTIERLKGKNAHHISSWLAQITFQPCPIGCLDCLLAEILTSLTGHP
jgi:hypothetical protein